MDNEYKIYVDGELWGTVQAAHPADALGHMRQLFGMLGTTDRTLYAVRAVPKRPLPWHVPRDAFRFEVVLIGVGMMIAGATGLYVLGRMLVLIGN